MAISIAGDLASNIGRIFGGGVSNSTLGTLGELILGIPNQWSLQAEERDRQAKLQFERELYLAKQQQEAAQSSAYKAMRFEDLQARMDRSFQTTSAQKAMDFAAAQAALDRSFQGTQAEKAQMFSALEAEKLREYQTASAQKAMDWEAQQAQIQRDYQTEMSNTAYQRAVQDLKAAGLNPILAGLGGASSPSGAMGGGYSSAGAMGQAFNVSGSRASSSMPSGSRASGKSAGMSKGSVDMIRYATTQGILNTVVSSAMRMASSMIGA